MLIALAGMYLDCPLDLAELLIIKTHQVQVQFNTLLNTRISKSFYDAIAVTDMSKILADRRQVVLAVGVMDMGEQLSALAHQTYTPTH